MSKVYCRYEHNGTIGYGLVEDEFITPLNKEPWLGGGKSGEPFSLTDATLLHPCEPKVILGLGGSYKNNWQNREPLKTVRWFLKPPSSAASPGDDIRIPQSLDELKVETELVIVIGKKIKNGDEAAALNAIFGYTIGNDITGNVDSYHKLEGEPSDTPEPLLGPGLKIGDDFAPFGPFIYTGIDWKDRDWFLKIENESSGKEMVHSDNTNNLVYPPEKIVSDLSRVLTLNPGDIIFTGTSKSIVVSDGDCATVYIEGLGTLINNIKAEND